MTSLITVPTKAVTNTEACFDKELNERAKEGWAFVYALRIDDIKYLLFFERMQ